MNPRARHETIAAAPRRRRRAHGRKPGRQTRPHRRNIGGGDSLFFVRRGERAGCGWRGQRSTHLLRACVPPTDHPSTIYARFRLRRGQKCPSSESARGEEAVCFSGFRGWVETLSWELNFRGREGSLFYVYVLPMRDDCTVELYGILSPSEKIGKKSDGGQEGKEVNSSSSSY
jgi:hypothetical protein